MTHDKTPDDKPSLETHRDTATGAHDGDAQQSAPNTEPGIPRAMGNKRLAIVVASALVLLFLGALLGPAVRTGLGKISAAMEGASDSEGKDGTHYYTCGMHPWVIEPKPGNCPICGMKLVPLDPAKFSGEVTISPEVAQNIGVRVEKVTEGSESGSIRTVATLTYDETRLVDVNLKVSGWIEKLYVSFQGAPVKRGQRLFDLYSPDLYAAEEEYLLAYRASRRAGESKTQGKGADEVRGTLLESARTKLSLFDVGKSEIAALEARGAPSRTMTIVSPQSGVIIEKQAFEGMKVTPGTTAYRIADLSHVWAMATVYEYQSQQIKVGQEATMTLSYVPGESFTGKVIYIYPYLDERTRQINVRLDFSNPKLLLKPGMYATVVFQGTQTSNRILVSRSAVIDTGERQVAFVALGQGRFEPRVVHMGEESEDGKVQILDGLKPGELVVTSGQFLIDSEARMREALARMMKGTPVGEATQGEPPSHEAASTPVVGLPKAAEATLAAAIDAYLTIGKALAEDSDRNVGISARKLGEALDALVGMPIPNKPHFWHEHTEAATAKQKALDLARAPSLDETRRAFAALSNAFSKLLHTTGVPASYQQVKLEDVHCPMYPDGDPEGSVWIQRAGAIRNPYLGKAMLTCTDWQRPLEVMK
jgi:Cu(I)/Ag(I) efflux system membrane fusion protein